MDIDKIRIQALQSAEDIAVQEILAQINLSNANLMPPEEVDIVKTLQTFASHVSAETIKLYHAELKSVLAKQGIEI